METIYLKIYSEKYKEEMIQRIACFFGFHLNLSNKNYLIKETSYDMAMETLNDWLKNDSELYLIVNDQQTVGFIRIGYRGDNVAWIEDIFNVAWIEDIFVDEEYRNRGIATKSIEEAEKIIKKQPQYTSVCLEVVPKNKAALSLYYKLGYDRLSIITVRKDFNKVNDGVKEKILGFEFEI